MESWFGVYLPLRFLCTCTFRGELLHTLECRAVVKEDITSHCTAASCTRMELFLVTYLLSREPPWTRVQKPCGCSSLSTVNGIQVTFLICGTSLTALQIVSSCDTCPPPSEGSGSPSRGLRGAAVKQLNAISFWGLSLTQKFRISI